jgi:cytochrome b subunit of formate dehydrogenase
MRFHSGVHALLVLLLLLAGMGVARSQSNDDCLTCHADNTLSMTKGGKMLPLFVNAKTLAASAHADLECISCHEKFRPDALPHARRTGPVKCLSCHAGAQFAGYAGSIHGKPVAKGGAGVGCVDCHSGHAVARVSDKRTAERKELAARVCSRCHNPVYQAYEKSDHGLALAAGVKGAPSCIDCHDEHAVVSRADSSSNTSRAHEAKMCLACHLDKEEIRSRVGPSAGFISSYESSVHGQALAHGNEAAAVCSDCHGSHEMKKGSTPASRVAKKNIAATCGQCHGDVREQFEGSIHGKALAAGVTASATCTDCHGEHDILSPTDPRSPVAPRNVSARVCSPCHASLRMTAKYGLASDRFQSFSDSYHGLAGRGGSLEVANCASCHGVHDIKPSTDSTSRIHSRNLAATCGHCHPGASTNFTKGSVHVIATSGQDEILYLVSTGYIILIVVVVGGMFLHNLVDFVRKSKRKLMQRRGLLDHPHPGHRLYLRMSLNERIQHGTLLATFLTLVLTGFALKYPDAWWVAPVREISPAIFGLRGILHRIAGVLMVLGSLYHIYYLLAVPRGKQLLRDLIPVRSDLTDAIGVMKYNLGISVHKPQLARFSYVEKSEYWALVWGTIVMAATGGILWFDNTFLNLLTKLWWDVARTVHYYEAWLATLSIIVWHFYFVIFNPETYPINLAFWKGTLTEEEMHEEHPRELQQILERERLQETAEAGAAQSRPGSRTSPGVDR